MTAPQIDDAFVVAPPTGARIRTRLKVSEQESDMLWQIGTFLGGLYRQDLADRFAIGDVPVKDQERARRKRGLTKQSSSRWAGSITRAANDQYKLALRNVRDEKQSLTRAVNTITKRLAVPVGESNGKSKHLRVNGYRDSGEWFSKSRRLTVLQNRLAGVDARLERGRPRVVVGGNRTWRNRHNLEDAGITLEQWQQEWDAKRLFLTADGDACYTWGNGTIEVIPQLDGTGQVRVTVPADLQHQFGKHITFATPVSLETVHRGAEWADRLHSGASVRYDITYNPNKHRWYLDASWAYPETDHIPTVENLQSGLVMGVDLNADHLAGQITDPSGNPVGPQITIPLDLTGLPATTRDARLREAITTLLTIARKRGCPTIAIENLNFADARDTGRETMGRGKKGKKWRRTVAGLPTAKFRDRLTAMAHTHGVWIIAVDPRYTSKHGKKFWLPELVHRSRPSHQDIATVHHAAATTISRRARRMRLSRTRKSPNVSRGSRAASPKVPHSARDTHVSVSAASPPPEDRVWLSDTG